jgi:hypothetical protein
MGGRGGLWWRGTLLFISSLGSRPSATRRGTASAVLIGMQDGADGRAGDMTALGIGAGLGHSFLGAAKTADRLKNKLTYINQDYLAP